MNTTKLAATLLVVSSVSFPATALDFEFEGNYYTVTDTENATVEFSRCGIFPESELNIPSTIKYDGTEYSITSINCDAFFLSDGSSRKSSANKIKKITIPASVSSFSNGQYIGYNQYETMWSNYSIFTDCASLDEISIDENNPNWRSVDGLMYSKDGSILLSCPPNYQKEIKIPYSVNKISSNAFHNCTNIRSLEIPSTISDLNDGVFRGCKNLERIFLPESIYIIGQYAFENCSSLQTLEIPNSVTHIFEAAFINCSALRELNIPSSVSYIGKHRVFEGCYSLENINVDENNSYYTSIDGILFDKNFTTLLRFPIHKEYISYEIPIPVKEISEGAFNGCDYLSQIFIPEGVTIIGQDAFMGCTQLKNVSIPATLSSIQSNIFYGCQNLQSIILPGNLIEIGDNCFSDCDKLETLYSLNPIPPKFIGTQSIHNTDASLTSKLIVYVPANSLEKYKTADGWKEFKNIYPYTPVEGMILGAVVGSVNDEIMLRAQILPDNTSNHKIIWSSSDTRVATVDSVGNVKFITCGSAQIAASCQDKTLMIPIEVKEVKASSIHLFPAEAFGNPGDAIYMLAIFEPENTTDHTVQWESSDESVASVNENGYVNFIAPGTAEITARHGDMAKSCVVNVSNSVELNTISAEDIIIEFINGGINLKNIPNLTRVVVNSIDGDVLTAFISQKPETTINLATGIYLIHIADLKAKILIK